MKEVNELIRLQQQKLKIIVDGDLDSESVQHASSDDEEQVSEDVIQKAPEAKVE